MGKVLDKKDSKSSASDEESEESREESRREWLAKFSTMKGGPLKGVRCAMGQANTARDMEEELTSLQRPIRMAGEEAKKRLEQYHKF